jgi:hypothetical protein
MMMNRQGGQQPGYPENWSGLTPQQKRQWRLDKYLKAENIEFVSAEAKEQYQIRAKRRIAFYNVEEYDRVPVNLPVSSYLTNITA